MSLSSVCVIGNARWLRSKRLALVRTKRCWAVDAIQLQTVNEGLEATTREASRRVPGRTSVEWDASRTLVRH